MAELNLNQITEKLNKEFTGETRKLVFWYDADGEFAEDVDTLALINAKVFHLEPDNQFYTKYFLECVDTTTSYLVYAAFCQASDQGEPSGGYHPVFQGVLCGPGVSIGIRPGY